MRRRRAARLVVAAGIVAVAAAGASARQQPPAPPPVAATTFAEDVAAPAGPLTLWYRRPAADHPLLPPTTAQGANAEWTQALPIGNGRLGAMIFGGVVHEHLQLNEDTLWAGGPYNPINPEAHDALPEVRRLIAAGQYKAAADLVTAKVLAKPRGQMPYETAGDLALTFPDAAEVQAYRRALDLDTAIARVTYRTGGVTFSREMFASAPAHVIAIRLTADRPGRIAFEARMQTPQHASVAVDTAGDLVMSGVNGDGAGTTADGQPIPGALKFDARVRVIADGGSRSATGDAIAVRDANAVTILIAAATSYRSYADVTGDPRAATTADLARAAGQSWTALRDAHVRDYQRLFRRVTLDLGRTDAAVQPTDERIRRFAAGGDPDFAALYFQFGRYLLISSSRPGGQPANLQGLWNDSMSPPWGSKYTININTEMNYWPAETTNLDETMDPLVDMVTDLSHTGARMARAMYGAGGWVTHHNTDLWRATGPIDGAQYGMWPMGGAWLTLALWDRYEYTGDHAYLQRIYPLLQGASQFFLDTLVEEPSHHWLVVSPSLSPENAHPFGTSVTAGATMDQEILRDLFAATASAQQILRVDADMRTRLLATRARLAPLQIGSAGQLQEWLEDWDLQAPEIHHRHVSHLFGLFPGRDIDAIRTPALAAAVKKSLEIRGDQATGWATAWRLNLWAHLGDGNHAYEILRFLLSPERTYPDMFDAHPPFQIDGNFGGTAGIAEMLVQSTDDEIRVLPALPSAWPAGHVTGLRARGGFDVDLTWKNGRVDTLRVTSRLGRPVTIRRGDVTRSVAAGAAGRVYVFAGDALTPGAPPVKAP